MKSTDSKPVQNNNKYTWLESGTIMRLPPSACVRASVRTNRNNFPDHLMFIDLQFMCIDAHWIAIYFHWTSMCWSLDVRWLSFEFHSTIIWLSFDVRWNCIDCYLFQWFPFQWFSFYVNWVCIDVHLMFIELSLCFILCSFVF